MNKLKIIFELFEFIKESKKWWLIPIIFFLFLLGLILIFAQSSPLSPFIYTMF